jgi:hypothetical protein
MKKIKFKSITLTAKECEVIYNHFTAYRDDESRCPGIDSVLKKIDSVWRMRINAIGLDGREEKSR